ncbi:MAG: OmpH family outer membrane protein [Nitrospiraceae bacterium]
MWNRGGIGQLWLIGTYLLLTGCAAVTSQPDLRIGVVDAQRVLNESTPGKKAKDTMATFTKNRQALIELEERELRRMEEDFVKQGSVLSANAKREREDQFRRRMAEYQQKASELNREVQEKQKEVLDAFHEKMERAVTNLAKQMNLLLVLERGRSGSTIYSDNTLDLSNQVINELNKE